MYTGLLAWEGLDVGSSPEAVAAEYWRLKRGLDALPTRDLFVIFELLGVHVEHTARDNRRLAQVVCVCVCVCVSVRAFVFVCIMYCVCIMYV